MKLDAPKNNNYAATIVRVNTHVTLAGLDNLVGIPVLGHQALSTRDARVGSLRVAFTSETQLSSEYAYQNSLHRDAELNNDPNETGYLDSNRRIRAMKMRGHVSNALLMPLESLHYAIGDDVFLLKEGDTFDTLAGLEICRKYEIPVKTVNNPGKSKVEHAFKRVTTKQFPEHISTDNYWRNKHLLKPGQEVVITQKLHGTSIRVGNVPVLRQKGWLERLVNKLPGINTADHEFDVVYGSRKVIKDVNNPNQNHYYKEDIWTQYGAKIAELIPEGYVLYGELVGWTPSGEAIQKGYTYHLPQGDAELYVYRVAVVNRLGSLADLSWDGVKEFCTARGFKWCPELMRTDVDNLDYDVDSFMDIRIADLGDMTEPPLTVSSHRTVDEGVVVRQDAGLVPTLLKAKSPLFLEHETKLLDTGEADLESVA